jgi:polar amino acid transport system substrate-binding protein
MARNTKRARPVLRVLCGVMLGLCATKPALADPVSLKIGYSDKESSFYLTGNGREIPTKPGIAIEMVEAAAKACDVAVAFSRYPGGRLLALIGDNTIDGVALLSFTPERLALAAYPMKGDVADPAYQIASLSYAFYIRSDSQVAWDGHAISGLARPIGANLGWSVVDDLKKLGLPVEPAKDTQNNFNKLLGGRIDAVAMHTTIGDSYLEENGLADKVKRLDPPISTKPYYLVLSRAWHDRNPDAAQCLWRSIADQHAHDFSTLLGRYRDALN